MGADALAMIARILCATFGHAWNRRLPDGHPSKTCNRCRSTEWA